MNGRHYKWRLLSDKLDHGAAPRVLTWEACRSFREIKKFIRKVCVICTFLKNAGLWQVDRGLLSIRTNQKHIQANLSSKCFISRSLKAKIKIQSGQSIIPVLFFNNYGISPKTLVQTLVWGIQTIDKYYSQRLLNTLKSCLCFPELLRHL